MITDCKSDTILGRSWAFRDGMVLHLKISAPIREREIEIDLLCPIFPLLKNPVSDHLINKYPFGFPLRKLRVNN